ncbi:MAG: lysophospholipid acyltransferase family protein [Acidimicrobiales bacterium]|jgi:1-acyl-sn-glycerol-3-phosphate acyltransferase|nr:lysophospholipid acyltransferase family protein [Acidimicrobiales bacterium]
MDAADRQERARRVNAAWTAPLVYGAVRFLVWILLWPYFRTRTVGRQHIPADGPVILAPVHRSNLDSLMLSPLIPRRLRALAKESLFKVRPLAWVIASLGAFPVHRESADRESMRIARELLNDGNLLLVFPEGKRHEGQAIGELFDGTAWLAAKTQSCVVPVGIAGTGEAMPTGARLPRPTRVRIVIGPPIDPPEPKGARSALRTWTEGLTGALQAVQDEAVVRARA